MSWVRAVLRQPLSYFVVLGAAVFVIDARLGAADAIQLTPAVRSEVGAQLQQTLGRPATEGELRQGLEEWLDTETLFREAMALGLEENDAVIRAHLARKLQLVVRERSIVDEPTAAELAAQLEANRARYTSLDSFDITHAFVLALPAAPGISAAEDTKRVDEALAQLRAGAEPKTVGDHFPRGPVFTHLAQLQLEQIIGAKLATVLVPEQLHGWQAVRGARGTHLIRVDAIHSGAPDVNTARGALAADIEEKHKQDAVREFTLELRKKYGVEHSPTN